MVTKEEAFSHPKEDYPTVKLSDKLINSLREIAIMRSKREIGLPVSEVSNAIHSHLVGLCGEAGVAGYYSIPMNLTYEHPIDPGYDFLTKYIPKNQKCRIDVKTTTRINGDLLVPKDNMNGYVDIYILCIKDDNYISLRGATSGTNVRNADTTDINSQIVYKIPQNELYNIPKRNNIEHYNLEMEGLSSVDIDMNGLIDVVNSQ